MLHSHICWRTEFFAGLYVSVHRSTIEKGQKEERKEKKDLSWVIRMEMGGGLVNNKQTFRITMPLLRFDFLYFSR